MKLILILSFLMLGCEPSTPEYFKKRDALEKNCIDACKPREANFHWGYPGLSCSCKK